MQELNLVVELSTEQHWLDAVSVAALIKTCRSARILKRDCIWRKLLRDRWPEHPGRRAYRRYCVKANFERKQQMHKRRFHHLVGIVGYEPYILRLQRRLQCWRCRRALVHNYVWTNDPCFQQVNTGFMGVAGPRSQRPSMRPLCQPCLEWLRNDPFPWPLTCNRPRRYTRRIQFIYAELRIAKLPLHRRQCNNALTECQSSDAFFDSFFKELLRIQIRIATYLKGWKKSAKMRWLARCAGRANGNQSARDALTQAHARRNHHALAARKRADYRADLTLVNAHLRREQRKRGRQRAAANKREKRARHAAKLSKK